MIPLRRPVIRFHPLPWNRDPFKGAYGLSWYERKPSSLSRDEEAAIMEALRDGRISAGEYAEWKEFVR